MPHAVKADDGEGDAARTRHHQYLGGRSAGSEGLVRELLGIDPYFERPGYFEFRLGDYQQELGLIDSRYAPDGSGTGTAGARAGVHHCFGDRSVRERPLMYNPHYLKILESTRQP
jgi:hypothetical protein